MSNQICSKCGTVGKPKTITKGSILIEVVLWICIILPGVIYSIWRLSTRHKACAACGSSSMVPLNSPIGRKLKGELSNNE